MQNVSPKGSTSKRQSQQSSWEGKSALDLGGQQRAGDSSKTRTSAKRSVWYLQPAVDLRHVKEVVDERSLPTQRNLVGRASLHTAQRRDTGSNVCAANEGECDALALARRQHAVQWQDIKNLEAGEERWRCRAWKLMQ